MADVSPKVLSVRNPSGHKPTSRNTCRHFCCRNCCCCSRERVQLTLSVTVKSSSGSPLSLPCWESAMASSGRQPWPVTNKAAKSSLCRARRDNVRSPWCWLVALVAIDFALWHLKLQAENVRATAAGTAHDVYIYRVTWTEQSVLAQLTFATVLCKRPTLAP